MIKRFGATVAIMVVSANVWAQGGLNPSSRVNSAPRAWTELTPRPTSALIKSLMPHCLWSERFVMSQVARSSLVSSLARNLFCY